jgi:hypothetical protein
MAYLKAILNIKISGPLTADRIFIYIQYIIIYIYPYIQIVEGDINYYRPQIGDIVICGLYSMIILFKKSFQISSSIFKMVDHKYIISC